jgi:hypothetical protein
MKTDMKNKNILQALTGIFVVSVLMIGALSIAPIARADDNGDDFGGPTDNSCCTVSPDTVISPDTGGTIYPDTYSNVYPDTYSNIYPDTYSNIYPDTYSYSTPSYGYSTGGYSMGGYYSGGYGYSTGGYRYTQPASNIYAPTTVTTNNNTCTNNSCNTNNNITNPAPVINNVIAYPPTQTQVQYCAAGYSGTYPNCYLNQPVVYNTATPYVSLTQVPYTGLDLGFWGTIAYWGAMVLFALVVAYLIVIKRVQNIIALRLKYFLFGSTNTHEESEQETVVTYAPVAPKVYATVPASEDIVDSFILSQINRPRRA